MNDQFIELFNTNKYSIEGFTEILGISRTRFYNIKNKKQILGVKTFYKYQVKILAHNKKLTKKTKIINEL